MVQAVYFQVSIGLYTCKAFHRLLEVHAFLVVKFNEI